MFDKNDFDQEFSSMRRVASAVMLGALLLNLIVVAALIVLAVVLLKHFGVM